MEIKNRFNNSVIHSNSEYTNIKGLVEDAVRKGINLNGADLSGADLHGADLSGADLCGSNLIGANLHDAYLSDADLCGADLYGADLSGAIFFNGVKTRVFKQISGCGYYIYILSEHIKIGCELHAISDWKKFSDEEIFRMDGKNALSFWRKNKSWIIELAENGE